MIQDSVVKDLVGNSRKECAKTMWPMPSDSIDTWLNIMEDLQDQVAKGWYLLFVNKLNTKIGRPCS